MRQRRRAAFVRTAASVVAVGRVPVVVGTCLEPTAAAAVAAVTVAAVASLHFCHSAVVVVVVVVVVLRLIFISYHDDSRANPVRQQ